MKEKPRVRFAPSPTGYLHIGGLRTALYNFLYAKKKGGDYFLRIEDTDQKRIVPDAIAKLIESLKWAGVMPEEGVFAGKSGDISERGKYGPYIQSKRLNIYQEYAHELVEKGKAYYCFCTPERLDSLRAVQEQAKLAPAYDKLCRKDVSLKEAKKRIAGGEKYVVRFDVPETGETGFTDAVRGKISFANKNLDDFVILKSDGYPTYHLAHVIDDHLMKTSLVFRGEEWLPSTPKHILMFQAFGWEAPEYAHLCVILNKTTKRKLSKRDGDVSVEDFTKKGYLPEAVINFIALLGWNPKTEKEIFSLEELIEEFDLSKLNKSGAIFDREKLDWMNGIYTREKKDAELVEPSRPYLGEDNDRLSDEYLEKIITVEKERMKKLSDIKEAAKIYLEEPVYEKNLLVWKKMDKKEILTSLQKSLEVMGEAEEKNWDLVNLKNKLMAVADPKNRGALLWPLRVALTGKEKSPSPWEIAWVVGKKESVKRIKKAISLTEN
ncbi:MAG: glutamate--tRNA ligase [Candidatus Moranbacteria bacterium RIFOXYB1_FULL_43_19]|nr:MAG: glutamate--tRNA ligase [Candidatus Moranbacteria bacterium RIFOXYA1_FULL_44_7]OGI27820.1 MAG: glutamate--tRNA ligase [Candidatus Moranbacteria bacterium RIFOXYB1_FULL_43_19]OGI34029.1 MAG: glutamate--tRNA ligase [Candidatus Moranbacteria bacterium RIFOXYC1_FULL_44_13]OGI37739.1 MAG: glutamate--tRNA ligase [Candidatus Moranbacteria bacterium RIFOXYD1_FULL_44_12]